MARALCRAGFTVRSYQRHAVAQPGIQVLSGDVRDSAAMLRAVEGTDVVIHAAGLAHVFRDPEAAPFADINERGTDVVARAAVAAGVRHLVMISSVAVYGGSEPGGDEEAACHPIGPYAVSKAAAETRAIEAALGSGTRVTVLRLATLYGEGDRGNVQRLLRLLESGRFVWIGSGTNRKSLIHVEDAARACLLPLAFDGEAVATYNVAAPPVAMRDVVGALARSLGRPVPRWRLPAAAATAAAAATGAILPSRGRALRQALAKWMSDDVYTADRFVRAFNFEAQVSLEEGIARQVAWWRASRTSIAS